MPRLRSPHSSASLDPLSTYLRDIGRTPLLTPTEERTLANRARHGDQAAREHLIRANLRLVIPIARRHAKMSGFPLAELIAAGNVGLVLAVDKFKPGKRNKFGTYATPCIERKVRAASTETTSVYVPFCTYSLLYRKQKALRDLECELGREPTCGEIAERAGLTANQMTNADKAARAHFSLAQQGWSDPEAMDNVAESMGRFSPPAEVEAETAEEVRKLLAVLGKLPKREARVLRLRFGIGGGAPLKLREIAKRIGTAAERVRQIIDKGMERVRLYWKVVRV